MKDVCSLQLRSCELAGQELTPRGGVAGRKRGIRSSRDRLGRNLGSWHEMHWSHARDAGAFRGRLF